VGPTAGLDILEMRKFLFLAGIKPQLHSPPAHGLTTILVMVKMCRGHGDTTKGILKLSFQTDCIVLLLPTFNIHIKFFSVLKCPHVCNTRQ